MHTWQRPHSLWFPRSRRWFLSAIRCPIGSPYIVIVWNVVFADKSRKLGWIWMKLGRWGWGLKRLSLARFQRNRSMGFGESAKKWVAEALFFVTWTTHHFRHFPWIDFRQTSHEHLSMFLCFIFRKSFHYRIEFAENPLFRVPCLCLAYGSREMYDASVPWWTSHRFILPMWLLLRDVPFSSYPRPNVSLSAMAIPGWGQ